MIEQYIIDENLKNDDSYVYKQNIYTGDIHNFIEFGQYKREVNYLEEEYEPKKNKKKKKEKEEIEEENIQTKNQILNI